MPDISPGVQPRDLSTLAGRMGAAWDALNGRPFGPGLPLQPQPLVPTPAPTPPPPAEGVPTSPRQFQYPVSVNTVALSPRAEQPGLTPFEQLRNLAGLYDVASICIASLIEEFQRKKWAIVARDKKRQKEMRLLCDDVRLWWTSPDRLNDFPSWLTMALYDVLTIDALTVFKRPNRGGGLYALDLVDGSTIKPLLDERGRTVAYQQVLFGRPESQYGRPSADGEQLPLYTPTDLMYKPRWVRSWTAYGFPPTEWIIMRVNQALRKQTFDLAYFTDGNVPEGLVSAPEGLMTPQQIQEFEEYFNAILQGQDQGRRRLKFLPWKAEVAWSKQFTYETALDYFMMQIACAAYGRMPQALGFVESVNRAQGVVQNDITELREMALAEWLKVAIFDPVIQNDLGERDLEWRWISDRIVEDELTQAQIHGMDIANGVISADESRALRYADELEGDAPKGVTNGNQTALEMPVSHAQNLGMDISQPQAPDTTGQGGNSYKVDLAHDKSPLTKRDTDPREVLEMKAARVMTAVYREQMSRIRQLLRGMSAEDVAEIQQGLSEQFQKEPDLVAREVLPLFDDLARQAAYGAIEQFAGADWNQVNLEVLKLAQGRARAFALQMSETGEVQTAEIVANWVETGGTMPELIERVSGAWQGRRPDIAAIDAVTDLFAQGQRRAWAASGVVKGYEINTARDSKVCPICKPKSDEYHDIHDESGLPGFHNGCRCDIRPVVKGPEEL